MKRLIRDKQMRKTNHKQHGMLIKNNQIYIHYTFACTSAKYLRRPHYLWDWQNKKNKNNKNTT